jgi:hypothetical protein
LPRQSSVPSKIAKAVKRTTVGSAGSYRNFVDTSAPLYALQKVTPQAE